MDNAGGVVSVLGFLDRVRWKATGAGRSGSVAGRVRDVGAPAWRWACGFLVRLVVVLSAGSLATTPLKAQTTNWSTGTGSWFTSGNWDNGVPSSATTNSNVTNGGTAQIAGSAAHTGNTLTINGGSTVDLQAGGSLVAGTVVLGNSGTLLLSGSTSVGANCVPFPACVGVSPFSGIEFNGGTLRSTVTGSMPSSIQFAANASGTILAASGQTLTISGDLLALGNLSGSDFHATFGSTTDTGTIVLAPKLVALTVPVAGTIEVAGGALRFSESGRASATIVDAGAKLDLSQTLTQEVFNLLGAGQVLTGVDPSAVLAITQGNFSGQITGAGQVQMVGTGRLRLSGVNLYTGGTTISRGILEIGNIGSLSTGPVTIIGQPTFPALGLRSTVSGTLTNSFILQGGNVAISATTGQTLTLASGSFTFANTTTEFGTSTDTGTIIFSPTSVTVGPNMALEVDGGTLRAGNSQLAAITALMETFVGRGAILDFNDRLPFPGGGIATLFGSGRVLTGANAATNLRIGQGVFSGVIDGGGSVTVSARESLNGMLILTGANTYSGGTSIDPGHTLQLGDGGTSGSIQGSVINDGKLTFNRSNTYVFDGVISGPGALQQIGNGNTILTSVNTYTGVTTVNAGVLSVNGSTASSPLTAVNAGGTLSGTGVVGNTTVNGGSFAPGDGTPASSITVAGNLALQSGAMYVVMLNPATSSFANVTGTATLGSATVNAFYAHGSYISKQYTILTAGSVSGRFSSLVNSNLPAGFSTSLSYDPTHAYLDLTLGFAGPNPSGGLNGNQQAIGNALINFFNTTGGIPLVFGTLTPNGLSQASGESATGSQQTTFNAMNQFMGVMTDPFIAGRGDGFGASGGASGYASTQKTGAVRDANAMFLKAPVVPFEQRWSTWTAGFGGSQTTDGNTAVGSNNTTSSVYGTAVGADYRFSPDTIAGFALAGGGTSFGVAGSGSGHSDLFQTGAFVRHNAGPTYISAVLAYGWQDITTNRTVTIAGSDQLQARFNANAFSGRLEGGYRFVAPVVGGGIGITPYLAAQFTTFDLPAYAESVLSGANIFALGYGAKDVTDTRSELGIRADKSYAMQNAILTLRGGIAWAHDYDPNRSIAATFRTLPGASFVVNGAAQASDSALTTASAELKWTSNWSVAATFEGEFSDVTRSYAGKGVVRYIW